MCAKISKQLLQEVERLNNEANQPVDPPQEKKPRISQTGEADGLRTWWRVGVWSDRKISIPLFILFIVFFSILSFTGFSTYFFGINIYKVALLVLGKLLVSAGIHFFYFRNWRKRIPFQLNGWEYLVDQNGFSKSQWIDAKLKFITTATISDQQAVILNAAWIVFCNSANKKYYNSDSTDSRERWVAKNLEANGSINTAVTGCLYRFCANTLKKLHNEHPCFTGIQISLSGKSYNVSIPSAD